MARFKVNARSREAAMEVAGQAACDHAFEKAPWRPGDEVAGEFGELGARAGAAGVVAEGESGGGAWEARMCRAGWRDDGGGEYASEYVCVSLRFVGSEPWGDPDAQDDPGHWRALGAALAEGAELARATPAAGPGKARGRSI